MEDRSNRRRRGLALYCLAGLILLLAGLPRLAQAEDFQYSYEQSDDTPFSEDKKASAMVGKVLHITEDIEQRDVVSFPRLLTATGRVPRRRSLTAAEDPMQKKARDHHYQRYLERRGHLKKNNMLFWRCYFNVVSCFRKK